MNKKDKLRFQLMIKLRQEAPCCHECKFHYERPGKWGPSYRCNHLAAYGTPKWAVREHLIIKTELSYLKGRIVTTVTRHNGIFQVGTDEIVFTMFCRYFKYNE